MFLVGLATVVRLCFTSDIVLLIDWLYCTDLFSCIAASVFNKLILLYFTLAFDASVDARLTCGEEVAAIRAAPRNWSKEATNTPLPHKKKYIH